MKIRKRTIVLLTVLFPAVLGVCHFFFGILYPKTKFDFKSIDLSPKEHNSELIGRINPSIPGPVDYPIQINIHRYLGIMEKYVFSPYIYLNKGNQVFHLYEMTVYWDNHTRTLIKNTDYLLFDYPLEKENQGQDYYPVYISGLNKQEYDFDMLFIWKKIGEPFICRFAVTYSLDDGEKRTQVLEYEVKKKWTQFSVYDSPFFRLWGVIRLAMYG